MLVKEIVIGNACRFCKLVMHVVLSMELAEDVNKMVKCTQYSRGRV